MPNQDQMLAEYFGACATIVLKVLAKEEVTAKDRGMIITKGFALMGGVFTMQQIAEEDRVPISPVIIIIIGGVVLLAPMLLEKFFSKDKESDEHDGENQRDSQ